MEARLTQLNYNEILMYLGYRGQERPAELEAQIRRCMAEVEKSCVPRLVYRVLPVTNGEIAGFPMEGNDVRALLASCQQAVLLAVTLGPQVEHLLMRREVTDMADAVIMDACASAAIENVCDHFEFDLREQLEREGQYLTDRFSPGYGDLPLATQRRLCEALNTTRRIGLTVTPNYIMVPRKSVTAVMGIADTPQARRKRGCEVCSMFLTCPYRKKGIACHESSDIT